jgi:hypothetical protein
VTYEIDTVTDDPAIAFSREAELISLLRRLHEGGPLTNLAPGGGSVAGPAPHSQRKHSATLAGVPDDNPERAVLNRFVLSIADMDSVVIKPASQFVARPTVRFPKSTRSLTLRQAVAIAASASANGIPLVGGCTVPRRLTFDGIDGLVENGVACDIITSGSATVIAAPNPADELFALDARQARAFVGLIGLRKSVDLGIADAI